MNDAAEAARRMWTLLEPVHVVTYFTAEARAGFERAGLRGFWRGYFAGRAAPLGAAGLLAPVARACAAELPFPNPVGVPAPPAGGSGGLAPRADT
jgi:hypothetical protein